MKKASFLISISYLCRHNILILLTYDQAARNQHLADANYMIGCTLDDIRPMGKQIDEFCFLRDSLDHRPAYQYLFARKLAAVHTWQSFHLHIQCQIWKQIW